MSPEDEKRIHERMEVGLKLDPEGDVVGQDYAILFGEIDSLRDRVKKAERVAEDRRQAIMDLHDQIRTGRP